MDYRHVVPRADFDVAAAAAQVAPLCEDVRLRGSAAVRDIALRFDGVELDEIRVDAAQLAAAAKTGIVRAFADGERAGEIDSTLAGILQAGAQAVPEKWLIDQARQVLEAVR